MISDEGLHLICAMCGKEIIPQNTLVEKIDNAEYYFDNNDCILFFKKFKVLYGNHFGQ